MAAQALASAAFSEGNYAVAFPYFGAERRGAPVLAFTRVDSKKIYRKTQVYEPDFVVVLDDSLLEMVDVTEGLKDGGVVVVNTRKKPEELALGENIKVATVDATGVALEVLGQPITNSSILGAFAKATGAVSMDAIEKGIMDIFGNKIGMKIAEKNCRAAKAAYDRTISADGRPREKEFEKKPKWLPDVKELPIGGAGVKMETNAGMIGPGSFLENKTGGWRTFMPIVENDKCVACQLCWYFCPEGCITMVPYDNNRFKKGIAIDLDYCKGCGICAHECPTHAIEMKR